MYLTCTISLLICYICWTITMQQTMSAIARGATNNAAAAATIFFIFAYSPCYNIGYNALTYSESPQSLVFLLCPRLQPPRGGGGTPTLASTLS